MENAEQNVKARVDEELRARAKAEVEADACYRAEAAERAKAAAADRKLRMESEARDAASTFRSDKKPRSKGVLVAIVLFVLLAGGLGALQLMPLTGYVPSVQQMISQRFNQPVRISNMRYSVSPEQVLKLEGVSIGSVQQIKADTVTIPMMPWTLLSGATDFDSIVASTVTIEPSGFDLLPAMVKAGGSSALQLRQLRLTGVKTSGLPVDGDLDPKNTQAQMQLAQLQLRSRQRGDEILKEVEEIIQADPNNHEALVLMGNLLAERGQIQEAVAHYDRALSQEPGDVRAHPERTRPGVGGRSGRGHQGLPDRPFP